MKMKTRILSLFMAIVMFLTSVGFIGFMIPAIIASGAENIDLSNALHFYIRHWHSAEDEDALFQGGNNKSDGDSDGDEEKDRYFVLVEGYIVPGANGKYDFYMVHQDDGSLAKHVPGGSDNPNEEDLTISPYTAEVNVEDGSITLAIKPLQENGEDSEKFAGLSISTGRNAITYTDNGLMITYNPYIHLVKGHAFYTPLQMIVNGENTATVDGNMFKDLFDDPEIDTAYVYTYINDIYEGDKIVHRAGDVVMSDSDPDQVCVSADDLPDDLTEGVDVQLSKFYSTIEEGMYTDNTVEEYGDDGRTFKSNLDAWYIEGRAPQVAMVLDASGSMAFAAETPSPIQLTDEQLNGITKLTKDGFSNNWDNYFLTDEKLATILNPRNTDNSMVGVSGYSYFVYSDSENNYLPLGYWEGVVEPEPIDPPVARLTFTNSNSLPTKPDLSGNSRSWLYDEITGRHASRISPQVNLSESSYEFKVTEVESWPSGDLKFGSANGLQLGSYLNHSGVLLDTTPSDGNFSLTFELVINPAGSGQIEMLYIGPMSSENESGYFRLYYDTETGKLHGSQTSSGAPSLTSGTITKSTTKKAVTLVFEKADTASGTVTLYIGGEKSGTGRLTTPITESNIIIAGVQGTYSHNGSETDALDIDTFTLYDCALSWNQISNSAGTPTKATRGDGGVLGSINIASSTWSSTPSKNGNKSLSHTQAGWYFITHAGSFNGHYNAIGTGKRLIGIPGGFLNNVTFKDTLTNESVAISDSTGLSYTSNQDEPIRFYVDGEGYLRCFFSTSESTNNTSSNYLCSYVYELTDAQYVRTEVLRRAIGTFVTDLNAASPAAKVSAVRFSTSEINYANINTDTGKPDFDKLLLQDWTNDTQESTAFLSMNYGDDASRGDARAYDYSTAHNLPQYNYGLTGSTSTWSGIQAYIETLAEYADKDSPKYMIIFTDGADSNTTSTAATEIHYYEYDDNGELKLKTDSKPAKDAAKTLTDSLKKQGYTIFTVLLDGEGIKTEDFNTAKTFLNSLSGPGRLVEDGEVESDEEYEERLKTDKGTYFFSLNEEVDKKRAQNVDSDEQINATDVLTEIFTKELLGAMIQPLEGYTVKNYIDPRFDLMKADGTVWHLNAGGEVVVGGGEATYTVTTETRTRFTLENTGTVDAAARRPYLRYDADKDMYYLEWVNQTIPTSAVGADHLAIWNAQFILKAKDDFIGGNAILTNGNAANMNWVYHPGDLPLDEAADVADSPSGAVSQAFGYDANSGTSDAKKTYNELGEETDSYPSKGFPRTVVNVKLLPLYTNPLSDVIYMGETVSPRQILIEIKDNYMTDTYYLEYLKRFAYARYDVGGGEPEYRDAMDRPLLDLLTEWLEIDNDEVEIKAFSVPYMYLPAVEWDEESGKIKLDEDGKAATVYNNTGDVETNQRCIVGVLTYRWEQLDPEPMDNYEPIKNFVKTDTERVIYSLTVEFTPLRVGDSYELFAGPHSYGESEDQEVETTAEGYSIVPITLNNGSDDDVVTYAETNPLPFEPYLRIGDLHKNDITETTRFDREKYINGNLDDVEDHRGDYALISDTNYKWNKNYKPAVGDEELIVTDTSDKNYPYGDAIMINNYGSKDDPDYRTLKAVSTETYDVVSGDIILELKMLIGELEKAAEKAGVENDDDHFKTDFTIDATRSFTDTEIIEEIKKRSSKWEDYDLNFKLTFELDYTKADIAELRETLDEPDADPNGYVSVFAKVKSIKVKYGSGEDGADTWEELDLADIAELPIGTYEFSLDSLEQDDNDILHFSTLGVDTNPSNFRKAYSYFDKLVLRGLATTNEYPEIKWLETDEEKEPEATEPDGEENTEKEYEITEDKVYNFAAMATSKDDKATFYLGTDTSGKSFKRGNSTNIGEKLYTDYRLGIILLTTGMTRLTVREEGAESNESFIYKITGKTYGDVPVELTITVHGGGETTVELPPGEYTVTEISDPDNSDWSWRYENKDTYGGSKEDEENLEGWTIDDLKHASTELWHSASEPELRDHKTVTFEHERNEKVWLGGENHKNNQFTFSNTVTE